MYQTCMGSAVSCVKMPGLSAMCAGLVQIYDDRSSKAVKVKGQDVNSATLIANISGFGREGRSFVRNPEAFLTEQGCDLDDVALFGSHVKNPRDGTKGF